MAPSDSILQKIQLDMIRNLPNAAGYSDSKGIFAARKAVMHYTQQKHIKGVTLEDIYIGNGGLRTDRHGHECFTQCR